MEHELKTWPEYFDKVVTGVKNFEIRKFDRQYAEHDILILKEFFPRPQEYTGRCAKVLVTAIWFSGDFPDGMVGPEYCVMATRLLDYYEK